MVFSFCLSFLPVTHTTVSATALNVNWTKIPCLRLKVHTSYPVLFFLSGSRGPPLSPRLIPAGLTHFRNTGDGRTSAYTALVNPLLHCWRFTLLGMPCGPALRPSNTSSPFQTLLRAAPPDALGLSWCLCCTPLHIRPLQSTTRRCHYPVICSLPISPMRLNTI